MLALLRGLSQGGHLLSRELGLLARGAASAAATGAGQAASAPAAKAPAPKDFLVYRWDPERPDKPAYEKYTVDVNA